MSFIEAIKYLILGLVQGITEVLPISSSGHVELMQEIIGVGASEGLLFLVLVNTGSLITLMFVFRKQIIAIIKDFVLFVFNKETRDKTRPNFLFGVKLIIASIPAAIIGFFFQDIFDNMLVEYGTLVSGIGLLFTGTVLIFINYNRFRSGYTDLNFIDCIWMGIAQAIALFPGISRSGMTAGTGIKRGVGVKTAIEFSFMMYIPASIGALLLQIYKGFKEGYAVPSVHHYYYYIIAFFSAVVATFISFKMVFHIFQRGRLNYFGFYCLAIGILSIALFIV
ncbi:MAG: undecaprenyl-diphosphate phosphatase [Candidatus Izemoplasmatales bacterium]|jgi:undecaprenyl-diphosphatase